MAQSTKGRLNYRCPSCFMRDLDIDMFYDSEKQEFYCIRCQFFGTEEQVLKMNEMVRVRYKDMMKRFYDNGKPGDAVSILKSYGMNLVRLRLWNDPYSEDGIPYGAGTNDLLRTVQMAKRLKDTGVDWMLDLHYSDFWADPGKQIIPKDWQGMEPIALAGAVYDFTFSVMNTLADGGGQRAVQRTAVAFRQNAQF